MRFDPRLCRQSLSSRRRLSPDLILFTMGPRGGTEEGVLGFEVSQDENYIILVPFFIDFI